jgi:predicted ArsR family transcriptional regulator
MSTTDPATTVEELALPLDRDLFLRTLLRELAGTLEEVVGLDDAVGLHQRRRRPHRHLDRRRYRRRARGGRRSSRDEVAAVLVDLKRRIEGDFSVSSIDDDRIVLTNRACPFGDKVIGRPSLCMMTSNVFGSIAADNLGYAKVEIQEAIARGDDGCRVIVHLRTHAGGAGRRGPRVLRRGRPGA